MKDEAFHGGKEIEAFNASSLLVSSFVPKI